MNLFYCVAGADTVNLDLQVIAANTDDAIEVWRVWASGVMNPESLEGASCEPYLVDLHIARPIQGYIEWGTFKHIPVELP